MIFPFVLQFFRSSSRSSWSCAHLRAYKLQRSSLQEGNTSLMTPLIQHKTLSVKSEAVRHSVCFLAPLNGNVRV